MRFILVIFLFTSISISGLSQELQNDSISKQVVYHQDFRIDDLMKRYCDINKNKLIPGYRVQIFSGTRKIAVEKRTEAIKAFPEIKSVATYETPDFKVQLGNYRTKLEAEKELIEIRNVFKGAFVVKTDIELPPLEIEKKKEKESKEEAKMSNDENSKKIDQE